jgi:tRNA-splicing ligase RtcB
MMDSKFKMVEETEATAKLMAGSKPITVIGTKEVRDSLEAGCLQQAVTIAQAPGVDEFVINPDAHQGYGVNVGSVFTSQEMLYPCAVGPDAKCSMSFLQFNIPDTEIKDRSLRRSLIDAIEQRVPTGPGGHMPVKARPFDDIEILKKVAIEGASRDVLASLNIPTEWRDFCEDSTHGKPDALETRLHDLISKAPAFEAKLRQLGGVGGGNHFMSVDSVNIAHGMEDVAKVFSLKQGHIGVLNHFGSRGFGFMLTSGGRGWPGQFRVLEDKFNAWHIQFPGGDKHNVYIPIGSEEADNYLADMNLASNFATVNHLLVCQYLVEAFQEILGKSVSANLVYYIAHNIIRREIIGKHPTFVHRKGATRALWGGHHELKGTRFESVGHPILLPGNPIDGSTIMVGQRGSKKSLNSVNHGAGRAMSRTKAKENFRQRDVDSHFEQADILTNCRTYPLDECSGSYKAYAPVIESVIKAGLALTVATLKPRMLIKDNDDRRETSV